MGKDKDIEKLTTTSLNRELKNCENCISYVYETYLFKSFLGIIGVKKLLETKN